jgi:nickel-dependent lactate racemase
MPIIKVPLLYWHKKSYLSLNFPESWNIIVSHMNGYNFIEKSGQYIKTKICNPINSKELSKLAKGREEVVILFDDKTRPTPVYKVIPYLLEELKKAGISDEQIRFINATGAHGSDTRVDFVKKLGEEIVEKYPIYNHSPFNNVEEVGVTSRGTPIQINKEVLNCDFKIGIGCILPHSMVGFSGGSKIIVPGISSIDTICYNHCTIGKECFDNTSSEGWRKPYPNEIREDMDEAAKIVGLDFKVDIILNERGEIVDIVAGNFFEEFKEGIKVAKKVYSTNIPINADVVIANTFLKANQAVNAMPIAMEAVKEGGIIVLIVNSPEGQCTHYLYGKFGKNYGGILWSRSPFYKKKATIVVFSLYKEKISLLEIADENSLIRTKNWDEVSEIIKSLTNKQNPKVVIFPSADTQIPSHIVNFF